MINNLKIHFLDIEKENSFNSLCSICYDDYIYSLTNLCEHIEQMIHELFVNYQEIEFTHIAIFFKHNDVCISNSISVDDFNLIKTFSSNVYIDIIKLLFNDYISKILTT